MSTVVNAFRKWGLWLLNFEAFEEHKYVDRAITENPMNTTDFITPTTNQTRADRAELLASTTCDAEPLASITYEANDLSVSDSYIKTWSKFPVVEWRATASQAAIKSLRSNTHTSG